MFYEKIILIILVILTYCTTSIYGMESKLLFSTLCSIYSRIKMWCAFMNHVTQMTTSKFKEEESRTKLFAGEEIHDLWRIETYSRE